jgi:hypothetical protein
LSPGATALPARFAALEPFCAKWTLSTTAERHRQRVSCTMGELRAFYDAMTPRMEEILAYLDGFPLERLPPPERRLLDLCLALADVSLAIEKYGAPMLPDTPYTTGFATDTTALG